ncbi:hypothetical protein FBU30_000424 [Linnemannia zychae]|nr:hypothetical protein FBU30_000424 [Linnemannia zychae]
MVRKRSYRSVRHHISQAFHAVDNNTVYENPNLKRRLRSTNIMEGNKINKAKGEEENQQTKNEKKDNSDEEQSGDSDGVSESTASITTEGSEAINHIYLCEAKDTSSSLYEAIGASHWESLTSMQLRMILPKDAITDLSSCAIDLAQMSYSDAQDSVLDQAGNRDIKKVLSYLLADDFLWKDADFNELEMIKHLFDPFLKTFISNIQSSIGRWDKIFLPSHERMKVAHVEGTGRRPDFFLQCNFPSLKCFVFVVEAKKMEQKTVLQNDLEKVALLLKDAIDNMSRQCVDVTKIKVFGMVIVGVEGKIFSMQLVARGIYLMRNYAVVYAPRSQFDLCVVSGTANAFLNMREELIKTMEVCRASRLDKPSDFTRPSFGTPVKVNHTGIKENFAGSPSLRRATLHTSNKS